MDATGRPMAPLPIRLYGVALNMAVILRTANLGRTPRAIARAYSAEFSVYFVLLRSLCIETNGRTDRLFASEQKVSNSRAYHTKACRPKRFLAYPKLKNGTGVRLFGTVPCFVPRPHCPCPLDRFLTRFQVGMHDPCVVWKALCPANETSARDPVRCPSRAGIST